MTPFVGVFSLYCDFKQMLKLLDFAFVTILTLKLSLSC